VKTDEWAGTLAITPFLCGLERECFRTFSKLYWNDTAAGRLGSGEVSCGYGEEFFQMAALTLLCRSAGGVVDDSMFKVYSTIQH